MAISLEPDFIVGDQLASGRLVAAADGFRPPAVPIHAVYPSRRHLSAKVRAFVDFIAERFAGDAPWTSLPNADAWPAGAIRVARQRKREAAEYCRPRPVREKRARDVAHRRESSLRRQRRYARPAPRMRASGERICSFSTASSRR